MILACKIGQRAYTFSCFIPTVPPWSSFSPYIFCNGCFGKGLCSYGEWNIIVGYSLMQILLRCFLMKIWKYYSVLSLYFAWIHYIHFYMTIWWYYLVLFYTKYIFNETIARKYQTNKRAKDVSLLELIKLFLIKFSSNFSSSFYLFHFRHLRGKANLQRKSIFLYLQKKLWC